MIRPIQTNDFDQILALNLESEHFLSPLDENRLAHLHKNAAYHRVVERENDIAGFLLAFCEGADYDSPNYQWFDARFESFLYVDRIAVSGHYQNQRLGSALYDDLFAFARENGFKHVTCEYYVEPLNKVSQRFHNRYRFEEVGSQWVAGGTKQVSLQQVTIR